jgi:hypothetical protein
MTLNEKQVEFTRTLGHFIVWCFRNDYEVIGAELFRTKEQAEIYAASGKGILNSVHRLKLAIDLFRVVGGSVSWDNKDYEPLGKKWKAMHPDARWGGDFSNRDAVHFSFEYKGRK